MSTCTVAGVAFISQLELIAGGVGVALLWTLVYRFSTRSRRLQ
ncbi:MAG: hypothetical protein Q8Q02_09630 [Nocardioides sp.]|nr:hypothetical protein [Nocardioides sp.]